MFIDYTIIELYSGNGGSGCISFRREKYIPKGGPDGGNGGQGGSIYALSDKNIHTLQDVRYNRIYKAKNGDQGSSNSKTGKDGEDIVIRVPIGTIIKNNASKEIVADFTDEGQKEVICLGGQGGRGNINYKSSTRQTPRYAQNGTAGEKGIFELELKILADVGLVGFPNAGKSTLLSVLSKARPKIADYPFTTLEPHLGIVKYEEFKSFTMADIPGLIEGASKGKGLGHKFLKHIERNRLLLFLIENNDTNPQETFNSLKNELKSFNASLLLKPIMLIRTKSDTNVNINEALWSAIPEYSMEISASTNQGLKQLVEKVVSKLNDL
ncbi:MAG: GTPase ObgE [Candidatus Neomarinimicrobiota bacterium]|nr:GTPase ObgE [Candidatus Neomarinimicrobiota bacterium]|tara:strand:+ start:363 stop:1337 length:975 start_codon:yes stop_codon:yes gene_type:complete